MLKLINNLHHRKIDILQLNYFFITNNINHYYISTSTIKLCDLGPVKRRQRKYFDLKTFRHHLKQQKEHTLTEERKIISRKYAKKPPENWTIKTFLENIGIEEKQDDIIESFSCWEEFISSTQNEIFSNQIMTQHQKRQIWKYINLYNHNLWPNNSIHDMWNNFQAPPLQNENKEWTIEEDQKLLKLCKDYDISFGDPWIYISWDMQREINEIQDRYNKIFLIPKFHSSHCEIAITKASRPLLMTRYFKLDCPFLYIIPSGKNFPLFPFQFNLSSKLRFYRRDNCF